MPKLKITLIVGAMYILGRDIIFAPMVRAIFNLGIMKYYNSLFTT